MREDYFYTEGLTVGYQGVPLKLCCKLCEIV